ncbi:MAG TPA: hypothetical protein VEQ63_06025, partial [Bryobacteraceae bacterium]|nr:hypothetical protein [Bryobacteraceae bacterium]
LVILLDARAGTPPTAPTLLCRHGEGSNFENLNSFLGEWEQWAAEIVESHLSYPMLSYYRSQHDNESWLTALAAVMDACALALVGIKGISTFQARMTFATANLAITELGRVFNVQPENFAKDRLPSTSFSAMRARLEAAGLFFLDDEMAEAKLLDFRSTYEPLLNGLSQYFLLDLPAWCASDKQLDNWQHGSGGRMAKELVEAAPSGAE